MKTNLDTLATALHARIDDELKASPWLAPRRPAVGIAPTLSDAELVTLAVMSALPGCVSERRWLRRARRDFRHLFPYLPQQSGYNKRLRRVSELIRHMIRILAQDTSLWSDDVWVVDSTPVGCGCSRETAKRSDLAGWAEYGYCASHSRYFWGLRLHLVCTLGGLPVLFALTGAKADERETLRDMPDTAPRVMASHPGQTVIGDKNYYGRDFEHDLTDELKPHLEGRDSDELLFTGPQNGALRASNFVRRVFDPAVTAAGLGHLRVTPHKLRHTAASLAIASGADVNVVQTMLGHKSATMTLNGYGHLVPDRLGEVSKKMHKRRARVLAKAKAKAEKAARKAQEAAAELAILEQAAA